MFAEIIAQLDRQSEPTDASTLAEQFELSVERFPERAAIVAGSSGARLTYAELAQQVERAARSLIALDVRRGESIGIWSPGSPEWIVTQLAAARIGATLVTVGSTSGVAELEQQLRVGRVGVLLLSTGNGAGDRLQVVVDALRSCPTLRRAIVLERDWDWFLAYGDELEEDRLAERELDVGRDDVVNVQITACSIDDWMIARLSQRDILARTCAASHGGRHDASGHPDMPVLHQRLATLIGSLVCPSHGSCVVI